MADAVARVDVRETAVEHQRAHHLRCAVPRRHVKGAVGAHLVGRRAVRVPSLEQPRGGLPLLSAHRGEEQRRRGSAGLSPVVCALRVDGEAEA